MSTDPYKTPTRKRNRWPSSSRAFATDDVDLLAARIPRLRIDTADMNAAVVYAKRMAEIEHTIDVSFKLYSLVIPHLRDIYCSSSQDFDDRTEYIELLIEIGENFWLLMPTVVRRIQEQSDGNYVTSKMAYMLGANRMGNYMSMELSQTDRWTMMNRLATCPHIDSPIPFKHLYDNSVCIMARLNSSAVILQFAKYICVRKGSRGCLQWMADTFTKEWEKIVKLACKFTHYILT